MEEEMLMCAPVQANHVPFPGTIESECADCGTKVWLAPSSQKLLTEKSLRIVCTKCVLARLEKTTEPPEFRVTKESAGEVRAWLERN